MTAPELSTLILSIVALLITIIGFFASLYFYHKGIELQNTASSVLNAISEKAQSIHGQVGGLFDKTLDAALGAYARQQTLDLQFDALTHQFRALAEQIQSNVEPRQESESLTEQIQSLQELIATTRTTADKLAETSIHGSWAEDQIEQRILEILRNTSEPLGPTDLIRKISQADATPNLVTKLSRYLKTMRYKGLIKEEMDTDGVSRFSVH